MPLPSEYKDAMRPLDVIHLDWLARLMPIACFGDYSVRLTLDSLVPLLMLSLIVIGGVLRQLAPPKVPRPIQTASAVGSLVPRRPAAAVSSLVAGQLGRAVSAGSLQTMPFILFLLFAFAPSISSRIFSAFACDRFGYDDYDNTGWYYLHSDYRVRCSYGTFTSSTHEAIKMVAYVFVVLWPVGVPLFYLALLCRSRTAAQDLRLAQSVAFLRDEYIDAFWYWEVAELCRKEMLTGFLLLVPQHLNFLRLVLALLICFCHLVLLPAARPFHSSSTAFVAVFTSVSLCCTLFAALLVKIVDVDYTNFSGEEVGRTAHFGFNRAFPLTMLILSINFGVLLIASVFFSKQAYMDASAPVLRLSASGLRPQILPAPGHRWALFLSHQWGNQVSGE